MYARVRDCQVSYDATFFFMLTRELVTRMKKEGVER